MQRQKPDLLASLCPVLSKERADVHGNGILEGHCRRCRFGKLWSRDHWFRLHE